MVTPTVKAILQICIEGTQKLLQWHGQETSSFRRRRDGLGRSMPLSSETRGCCPEGELRHKARTAPINIFSFIASSAAMSTLRLPPSAASTKSFPLEQLIQAQQTVGDEVAAAHLQGRTRNQLSDPSFLPQAFNKLPEQTSIK